MGFKRRAYFAYMDLAKFLRNSAWSLHKAIQAALRPNLISVNGYNMLLDKGDSTGYSTKDYEKETTGLIKKEVGAGDFVIDLGANIRYYTLLLAKIVGETGKVFAFEPEVKNFEILKRNIELNGVKNVVLIKKAVVDKSGRDNLYLDPKYIGSHVMYNEFTGKKPVVVETTTLDDFFKDHKGRIDFIKMDIDGSEIRAIKGMSNLLKKNKKIKMIAEYAPSRIVETGATPEEYLKLIKNKGFSIRFLKDNNNENVKNLFCVKNK